MLRNTLLMVVVSVFMLLVTELNAQVLLADPNQDGNCDQFDLIQVLQAGKYLTGEPATWGEGDWNGAPGGSHGNPPPGDGLFDQLDIINFLNDGCPYLTGPYADFGEAADKFTRVVPKRMAPEGVLGDDQTSIVYHTDTGEVAVDAPADVRLTSLSLESDSSQFVAARWDSPAFGGSFDIAMANLLFKATFGGSFGSFSFGDVGQPGLTHDSVLGDLIIAGSLAGGGNLGPVDLVYMHELFAGDANRDFSFDQLDIVQVLQAGKYLSGQPATWGEGDWDGGPGGYPGEPPQGDGLFGQKDIVAALQTGNYLQGPNAAIKPGGVRGDGQTSIIYDVRTGEIAVDAPAGKELTSINIDSAGSIFTGDPAQFLGDSFDNYADNNIFRANFGSSFGSLSFGNVAQTRLSEEFARNDLTVFGSLTGGGDLGPVDLIYIPEPSSLLLALLGVVGLLHWRRWRR